MAEFAKYRMMLKAGLPEGAVRHKLVMDGYDPDEFFASGQANDIDSGAGNLNESAVAAPPPMPANDFGSKRVAPAPSLASNVSKNGPPPLPPRKPVVGGSSSSSPIYQDSTPVQYDNNNLKAGSRKSGNILKAIGNMARRSFGKNRRPSQPQGFNDDYNESMPPPLPPRKYDPSIPSFAQPTQGIMDSGSSQKTGGLGVPPGLVPKSKAPPPARGTAVGERNLNNKNNGQAAPNSRRPSESNASKPKTSMFSNNVKKAPISKAANQATNKFVQSDNNPAGLETGAPNHTNHMVDSYQPQKRVGARNTNNELNEMERLRQENERLKQEMEKLRNQNTTASSNQYKPQSSKPSLNPTSGAKIINSIASTKPDANNHTKRLTGLREAQSSFEQKKQAIHAAVSNQLGGGGSTAPAPIQKKASGYAGKKWDVNDAATTAQSNDGGYNSAANLFNSSAADNSSPSHGMSAQPYANAASGASFKTNAPQMLTSGQNDQLPDGWIEQFSVEYQTPYYVNTYTGESTWEKPMGSV